MAEVNASFGRVRNANPKTGILQADLVIAQQKRKVEYASWSAFLERGQSLAPPSGLKAAHALRLEALDHLGRAGKLNLVAEVTSGENRYLFETLADKQMDAYYALLEQANAKAG